jgi:hypothetical protein
MSNDATMQFGEEIAGALLGLDALYATEFTNDRDETGGNTARLVVLQMLDHLVPEQFDGYDNAVARFRDLKARAATLPEADRQVYYAQTCESAIAFCAWRSHGLGFRDQISRFLHVPATPADTAILERLKLEMRQMLNDLGFSGDLSVQIAAWEERQRVPPDEVEAVLNDLLSDAWDLTAQHMEMPGEKSDGMRAETVSGVHYNAKCDFSRRLIQLNIEPTLTLPGLRHLAVHEGYPGHYVQFKRRQVGYLQGNTPADALLSVVNTASSTPFEGIADAGMAIIGWSDSPDDRLAGLLTRYRAGIATRAAWRLHADRAAPEIVREELLRDALVGGEGWVAARMRFISAPDRAALIWSYWQAEPSVMPVWERVADTPSRHQAYFNYIYDRMHSAASIAMFNG